MNLEGLFSFASTLVLPGWLLLIVAPKWKWTSAFIASFIIPVLLGGIYLYLLFAGWGGAEGGFGSLAEVRKLFESQTLLLAGWIHYLAFDLFVGAWEVRDAARLGISHLLVVPCLLLTFLFGPVGLLLYLGLRLGMRRRFLIDEGGGAGP